LEITAASTSTGIGMAGIIRLGMYLLLCCNLAKFPHSDHSQKEVQHMEDMLLSEGSACFGWFLLKSNACIIILASHSNVTGGDALT
jgi:hypothetical protein